MSKTKQSATWRSIAAAVALSASVTALFALAAFAERRDAGEIAAAFVSSAVAVAAGVYLAQLAPQWSRRRKALTLICVLSLPLLFVYGATTQLELEGKPVLRSSDRAVAAAQAKALEADLRAVASQDALFEADLLSTTTRLDEYAQVADSCADITNRWANANAADTQFAAAAAATSSAADLCARTAVEFIAAAETGDQRVRDAADLTREAFIGEALRAGRLLSVAAELAKVPLSVDAVTE